MEHQLIRCSVKADLLMEAEVRVKVKVKLESDPLWPPIRIQDYKCQWSAWLRSKDLINDLVCHIYVVYLKINHKIRDLKWMWKKLPGQTSVGQDLLDCTQNWYIIVMFYTSESPKKTSLRHCASLDAEGKSRQHISLVHCVAFSCIANSGNNKCQWTVFGSLW